MKSILFISSLLLALVYEGWCQSPEAEWISNKINTCHETHDRQGRSGEGLNTCLKDLMMDLRPQLAKGIPSLNVPSLEPINLPPFGFNQSGDQLRIVASFSNVEVVGFSEYSIKSVVSDAVRHTLQLNVKIPRLRVKGNYVLRGNAFLLPLDGRGPFRAIISGIDAVVDMDIIIKKEGNKERLGTANTRIDFTVKSSAAKLRDLFPDDSILQDTVDLFIQENDQMIIDEIKHPISLMISEFLGRIMDSAFTHIPIQVVYRNRRS